MLSIVVPVYGQLHLVMQMLFSLATTVEGETEIILVDDATPDFDLTKVPLPFKSLVLRAAQNGGFAAACNIGASQAKGDILFFLNSDTVAHKGWYAPLVGAFTDGVGIVGPKLVFPANNWCPLCHAYLPPDMIVEKDGKKLCVAHGVVVDEVETIQNCGGWFDAGKGPFHRYLGWRADDPRVNVAEDVSWTTGAALAIRADVFRAAQGFDQSYGRGYFEDVDLCMRVSKAGLRIRYEPAAVFTHFVAQSTTRDSRSDTERGQSFRYNSRLFHLRWDELIKIDRPEARYVDY